MPDAMSLASCTLLSHNNVIFKSCSLSFSVPHGKYSKLMKQI